MLAETLGRCADTGIGVHAVEAITLGPGAGLDGRESVFETAAALGARYVNVICEDPDTKRFAGLVAALAELGRPYGVWPVIECTAWRPVWRLADAAEICRRSGGRILLDALHVQRCGTPLAEIAALDPALLSYLQLCDAPLRPPSGPSPGPRHPDSPDSPEAMPRGRRAGPDDARLTEARSSRLLPGAGELPLVSLLGALPADLLVSVEAPNAAALALAGPGAYAARAGRAARAVAG
jgi:sugar phosphate isomerase/epimerase